VTGFVGPLNLVQGDAPWPISKRHWDHIMSTFSKQEQKASVLKALKLTPGNEMLVQSLEQKWHAVKAAAAYATQKINHEVRGDEPNNAVDAGMRQLGGADDTLIKCVLHPGLCAKDDAAIIGDCLKFCQRMKTFLRSLEKCDRGECWVLMFHPGSKRWLISFQGASNLISGMEMAIYFAAMVPSEVCLSEVTRRDGLTVYEAELEEALALNAPMTDVVPSKFQFRLTEHPSARLRKLWPVWFSLHGWSRAICYAAQRPATEWKMYALNAISCGGDVFETKDGADGKFEHCEVQAAGVALVKRTQQCVRDLLKVEFFH